MTEYYLILHRNPNEFVFVYRSLENNPAQIIIFLSSEKLSVFIQIRLLIGFLSYQNGIFSVEYKWR